jgi:hypothetical protein
MDSVLEKLSPIIDTTIEKLNSRKFKSDPIAGPHFSKIVSVMSSAYKRHGFILERSILETLATYNDLQVWEDRQFFVPEIADHIVSSKINDPEQLIGTAVNYEDGPRALQVDCLCYNTSDKTLNSYEIKRGNGLHDSGKRRSILRDLLCTQVLLKSYGTLRGLDVSEARSYIIFYYGERSIRASFSLTKVDLDDHFGRPVVDSVEAVNELFRQKLFQILTQ